MLAVHGLPGDSETRGDVLPRPAVGAGVVDLQLLELLGERTQRGDGSQPDVWVSAGSHVHDVRFPGHGRQHVLTRRFGQAVPRRPCGCTLDVVDVTLLFVDGCPNREVTEQRIRQVLRELALPEDTLALRVVETPEQAEQLSFPGSPTVLVDGQDPFADPAAPVGLSCRMYRSDAELAGAPSLAQLTEALSAAR